MIEDNMFSGLRAAAHEYGISPEATVLVEILVRLDRIADALDRIASR